MPPAHPVVVPMPNSLRPSSALPALLLGLLLLAAPAAAQDDRAATEQRLRELQDQIEQDQRRLSQTTEAEKATLETLENLNRQIALRTELVHNYRRRMRQISGESDSLRTSLAALRQDLDRLKGQYQRRAVHAYKYGRMHDLALILAARSINQMLIRVSYLRRFSEQRSERLDEIMAAGQALRERRAALDSTLQRNRQLLAEAEHEQRNLARLQQDRQQVIAGLRAQRTSLEASLNRRRAAARELQNRIRELAAAATTRRREREATDPNAAAAFVELTGSFEQNRGRLPWPVDGVVREPYGDVVNPVYGTTTPNPGLLIDTPASAEVRAVFDGVVVEVSILPDYGTYISIEHGDYQSVYSNFSMTYVAEGDRVRAGQVIGRAGTDAEPKGRALFFALFKKGVDFDPRPWLRNR